MWDAIRRVTASQKPDGSVRNIVVGNRTDNSAANCEVTRSRYVALPARTVHICWVGMCQSHSADPHRPDIKWTLLSIGGIGAFDLVSLNPILRRKRKQTLPIARSHFFVDSAKNPPRSSRMVSRVEKTRRARAANKVTSSSPLFFKFGLHRILFATKRESGCSRVPVCIPRQRVRSVWRTSTQTERHRS